jgi:hypothetical protein
MFPKQNTLQLESVLFLLNIAGLRFSQLLLKDVR